MPVAHILQASPPLAVQSAAVVGLVLGGAAVLRFRGTRGEAAGWAAFAASFAACSALVVLGMVQPSPPGYSLSLAVPSSAAATSPVQLTVCGRASDGSGVATPDGDHVLSLSVDGTQVASGTAASFTVAMSPGSHRLRIELLTREHQVFTPAVAMESTITVTGPAPLHGAPRC